MAKPLPYVISIARDEKAVIKHWEGKQGGAVEVEVDSNAWQTWLENERSFTVLYYPKAASDAVRFTVRPEKRGELTYWQAWKTVGGKTIKKYVGRASKMTKPRLDEVGEWFYEQVRANVGRESRESRLEKAIDTLSSLVIQLVDHCDNPRLAEIARSDLKRIEKEIQN